MILGENKITMSSVVLCSGAVGCALRGLEKEITLTFSGHVILDAQRQSTGSLKVKIDLCRGSYRPRT